MASFEERLETAKNYMFAENTTVGEAFVHLLYYIQYERLIAKHAKLKRKARRLEHKLNGHIAIHNLRADLDNM